MVSLNEPGAKAGLVTGVAVGGAAATDVGRAEVAFLVANGVDRDEAVKRVLTATGARYAYGLVAWQWILVAYIVGWGCFIGIFDSVFRYHLGWESDVGGEWVRVQPEGLQHWYALLALAGCLFCFGTVYLALLGFAHIWRWESKVIPGYNDHKKWWRLYKKPVAKDVFPEGHPNRDDGAHVVSEVAKWVLLYLPAMLIAALAVVFTIGGIIKAGVHNVM